MRGFCSIFLGIVCTLFSVESLAWNHAISLGFGDSQEVGHKYYNYGLFLNMKLHKFDKIDRTLIFTIDSAIGFWNATIKHEKRIATIALSLAARAYFLPPEQHKVRSYLLLSFGPAYLSNRHFGDQEQGSEVSLQTTMGIGSEVTSGKRDLDFNLRLVHYCNAGVFRPNQGFNILLVGSVGYLF